MASALLGILLTAITPSIIVTPVFSETSHQGSKTKLTTAKPTTNSGVSAEATSLFESPLARVSEDSDKLSRGKPLGQVTQVSQLSDIQTTDWTFQTLQSLVENYGCITEYHDSTYQNIRTISRYKFAVDLNACINRVYKLIASSTADLMHKEDLQSLQKLQEEFSVEMVTKKAQVGASETRNSQVEAQQFSTTTRLTGEAVFAVTASNLGGNNSPANFQNRVRLYFETSFTGQDTLYTGLAAGNSPTFTLPSNPGGIPGVSTSEGTLTFQNYTDNNVILDFLSYEVLLGEKAQFFATAADGATRDYLPTAGNDPIDDGGSGGSGSLSHFGAHNSIYYIGGGVGIGFNYQFNDLFQVSANYLAGPPNLVSPDEEAGLFNGNHTALGQLTVTPDDKLALALTYVNSYHGSGTPIFNYGGNVGVVGSSFANFPGGTQAKVSANSMGFQASYLFSPKFVLSAWVGYTNADIKTPGIDNGEIWNYALTFAFPDLFKTESLGALVVGVQPYLGNLKQLGFMEAANDLPLHVEAFYRYQLNDYVAITPGIIFLNAPDQQEEKKAVLGVIRTTFTF